MPTVTPTRFFFSYAHHDQPAADDLVGRLTIQMRASAGYDYEHWRDTDLLVGEDWDARIRAGLDRCDVGLLLMSPAFLGSEYITKVEIAELLGAAKPVIPVVLAPISPRQPTHGLEGVQWFYAGRARGKQLPYAECTTSVARDAFALELFEAIERRLDHVHGSAP